MATAAKKPAPQAARTAPTAAAKPATSTQVATRPANAVALPADLMAELAATTKDAAAKERPSTSKISTQGGMLTYMGNPVPGNKMEVIILAAGHRNAFYADAYDPNDIKNPNCFAFSEDGEDMSPHENVAEPVNDTCHGCPNMEWGSAGGKSKAKACKETRRLLLLPADAIDDGVEGVEKAEAAMLDLPVTSVRGYSNFVNVLATTVERPVWAVVSQVEIVRDPKTQFKVVWTPLRTIDDADVLRALKKRVPDAMRVALIPYDESYKPGEEEPPQPTGKPTGKPIKKKF